MVVPLVLWGYMGKTGAEREEDQGEAGTLYNGLIKVTKGDYNRHLQSAPASYCGSSCSRPSRIASTASAAR